MVRGVVGGGVVTVGVEGVVADVLEVAGAVVVAVAVAVVVKSVTVSAGEGSVGCVAAVIAPSPDAIPAASNTPSPAARAPV
jgi:hypothetical protein